MQSDFKIKAIAISNMFCSTIMNMKRPSNLIIAFILAIASIFLVYAASRMLFRIIAPPEIEIEEKLEEENESQLYNLRYEKRYIARARC